MKLVRYGQPGAGRHGLGTVFVFGAGNDRQAGQSTMLENLTSNRYAITVAATGNTGAVEFYSTPGDSVLVAAPGGSLPTTDRTGSRLERRRHAFHLAWSTTPPCGSR